MAFQLEKEAMEWVDEQQYMILMLLLLYETLHMMLTACINNKTILFAVTLLLTELCACANKIITDFYYI